MLVLGRSEQRELGEKRGWLLIYGRRKVGKSFLIRRAFKWDLYITATRAGDAILEEGWRRMS